MNRISCLGLAVAMASAATVTPATPAGAASRCGRQWSSPALVGRLPSGGEISGFVSSPSRPGFAWMVGDSGQPASVYSFQLNGGSAKAKAFPVRGAHNGDWEDIAYTRGADGRGHLWILDNIHRKAKVKDLYEVAEPDPSTGGSAKLIRRYRWSFPDGRTNAEVLFALDGKLHVVSKNGVPTLYRFESPLGSGVNKPVYKGRLPTGSRLTLASTSADERLLVTSATHSDRVWVQESSTGLAGFLSNRPVFTQKMSSAQREGGDFYPYGSCDIILISEAKGIYRLSNK